MHTAALCGFASITAEVSSLIIHTEVHFLPGSGMRMDTILTNYNEDLQGKLGDVSVAVGTVMGDLTTTQADHERASSRLPIWHVVKNEEVDNDRRYGEVTVKCPSDSIVESGIEDHLGT